MNWEEQLKIAINNFIWMHGPCATTLQDAELMACRIYDLFINEQNKTAVVYCGRCNGSGQEKTADPGCDSMEPCGRCGGTGRQP